jgi:hypothetical protein
VLEIYTETGIEQIPLHTNDIEKVGINERVGETRVEIWIGPDVKSILADMSGGNVGKEMVIKTQNEIIFSGIIQEPIIDGCIGFGVPSENDAMAVLRKIGREPDYYLKLSPEEIEDSESYLKPGNNPWHEKSMDAQLSGNYNEAIRYAKRAIEKEPCEPFHYAWLGYLYNTQTKSDLALEQLIEAEKRIGKESIHKYPGVYLDLAELYAKLGKNDKALEIYQKYLSTGKNNLKIRLSRAKMYEKMGRNELAIQEYLLLYRSGDEYFEKQGSEGFERLQGEIEGHSLEK